tara:strand:- start:328452 stop:328892 length:441 start_codon:yes stop_codon:yes gene_type:complete
MELNSIEKLLEKYENAETSLKEEALLKDYFSNNTVPTHLQEYKLIFNYFSESKTEQFTKTIPLKRKTSKVWWLSIAASIALVFSVYFMNDAGFDKITPSEQQEAALAFKETQKAFQLISKNLNKGENIAMSGLSEFEKAQNKVFKK